MTKATRKYHREMSERLERMIREREKFRKEEAEFEERKEKYAKKMNSEAPSDSIATTMNDEQRKTFENSRTKSAVSEVSTGREVFHENKRYQNFTFGELIPNIDDVDSSLSSTRMLLQLKIMPLTELTKGTMKQLFYLMSLDEDCTVSESCCYYLVDRVNRWLPKISQIINVFTNWGATYESLGMNDYDVKLAYKHRIPEKHDRTDTLPNFRNFHHEHTFAYLRAVIPKAKELDLYSEKEVVLLMRILIKMSMDKRFPRIIDSIKATKLIYICVENLQIWNHSKVKSIAKCIYDEKESLHNLISIVTTILSRVSRCDELRSCLAFAILRKIILKEKPRFEYPCEDAELLELVKRIKTDHISPEDMSSIHFVVLLIHSCIHGRNILEEDGMDIVEGIQGCFEQVKIALSRQPSNYDAELLAGRISACTAVWTLFGKRNEPSYSSQ